MHRETLRLPLTVPLKFKRQSKFYIITGRRKVAELCHITELVTYCRRLGLNNLHENDTKKKETFKKGMNAIARIRKYPAEYTRKRREFGTNILKCS